MQSKTLAASMVALGLIAGCATPPEKIAAIPSQQPCTAVDKERLAFLYNKQQQTAQSDAMGVFLVGLPLGSMGGGNNEAEIATLKGRCGTPTT